MPKQLAKLKIRIDILTGINRKFAKLPVERFVCYLWIDFKEFFICLHLHTSNFYCNHSKSLLLLEYLVCDDHQTIIAERLLQLECCVHTTLLLLRSFEIFVKSVWISVMDEAKRKVP